MTIQKIKKGLTLGAIAYDKVTPRKINEIIDEVNDLIDGEFTFDAINVDTIDSKSGSGIVVSDNIDGSAVNAEFDSLTATDISLDDGTVSDLAVKLGADGNNGIYGISDTQLGFAVEGALKAGVNSSGLFTDIISEQTAAAGVTIDGVVLKDNNIAASNISGNGSVVLRRNEQVGTSYTILITDYYVYANNTSAVAITLPEASTCRAGQTFIIKGSSNAGTNNCTITRSGSDVIDGANTYVIDVNYKAITLITDGVSKWEVI